MKFLDTSISCLSRQHSENTFTFQTSAHRGGAGSTASLTVSREVQRDDPQPVLAVTASHHGSGQARVSSSHPTKEVQSFLLKSELPFFCLVPTEPSEQMHFAELLTEVFFKTRYVDTIFFQIDIHYSDISSRYILI